MVNSLRRYQKGDVIFREGDPAEEMYIIRGGRIAITKAKGADEIILAEKKEGEMLGEMGFFDNRPRSAGARAAADVEVIVLPFDQLHAQFKTFPEWLKAIVKTVVGHLREANQRIKNLESVALPDEETFPPHLITRLCAILSLLGFKNGVELSYAVVREYCIQVFQQPTGRLDRLMEVLSTLGYLRVEDLGEGRRKITLLKHAELAAFTEWHNRLVFAEESKRVDIAEREMNALRALVHYGRGLTPDRRGFVTVNLTEMSASCPRDLGFPFAVHEADPLVEKGLAQEKHSAAGGTLTMAFESAPLATMLPHWELLHALRKVRGR